MEKVCIKGAGGALYFDAVFKTDHTSKITLTEHPVEKGANIADHAYLDPSEVSLEVGMSDTALQAAPSSNGSRSVAAYKALRELQEKRQPVTVVTRLKTYRNMMLESITAPDDYTTMFALKATVFLREIITVSTETVQIAPRPGADTQKLGSTNAGTKQPDSGASPSSAPARQSILKQAAGKLGL